MERSHSKFSISLGNAIFLYVFFMLLITILYCTLFFYEEITLWKWKIGILGLLFFFIVRTLFQTYLKI